MEHVLDGMMRVKWQRVGLWLVVLLSGLGGRAFAEQVARTFFIPGMECGSCVFLVQQAAAAVDGVKDVQVFQLVDGFARVTFDSERATEHGIAQAIREAPAGHGTPYLATMRYRIAQEKRRAQATKALLEGFSKWIEISESDKGGVIAFRPLGFKERSGGWSVKRVEAKLKSSFHGDFSFELLEGKP